MGPISTEPGVSVIPVTCARCRLPIPAGEAHLRHTDRRTPDPVRFAECARCASRAGRAALLGGARGAVPPRREP